MPVWNKRFFFIRVCCLAGLLFALVNPLFSRNNNEPVGTRSWGMGNASVCVSDAWSMQHNVAGIAGLRSFSAGMYVNYQPLIPQLQQYAVCMAKPFSFGSFGLVVSRLGIPQYSEIKAGLGYARMFGKGFRAGLQLNYLQTSIGDQYGRSSRLAAEAGIQAKLTSGLWAGVHVYNINRAKSSALDQERIPTIVRLGFLYTLSEKVMLAAEFEKQSSRSPLVKAGMEYRMHRAFVLRGGLMAAARPGFTAGAGFYLSSVRIDVAVSYLPVFGIIPHVGGDYTTGFTGVDQPDRKIF
jgi:hypothetical protein